MPSSLRWKLLAWHALWVVVATGVVVATAYFTISRSINRSVDEQLEELARGLVSRMEIGLDEKFVLELLPEQIERFRPGNDRGHYYRIWSCKGAEVDSSAPSIDIPVPLKLEARDRSGFREVVAEGPECSLILVGRNMEAEHSQLAQLASRGILLGGTLLLVMLVGGWYLVSRALLPLDRINEAAKSISASNLSERIDTARMETELSRLSETINDAFDRLQRSYAQQAQFTADASHELRTPLSVILAESEFALSKVRTGEDYVESLTSVDNAARRMNDVVERLLTLARVDAGQRIVKSKTFELSELVEANCELLQPLARERNVEISTELSSVQFQGDADKIGDAMFNLLSNAIQYNRDPGKVKVTLAAIDNGAKITVADEGVGIPAGDLPNIFDRFFRVDRSRVNASVGRGTGLGLAITKWIIESHGGSIEVSSVEGEGSEFTVTIHNLLNTGGN